MSSVFKYNQSPSTNKVIGIKPIINNSKRSTQENDIDTNQELALAHQELQLAKEQLEKTELEQKELIARAQKQIETEKEQWEEQKQKLIQEAHESGYEAGFHAGEEAAQLQFNQLIEEAKSTIELAKEDYKSTLDKSEDVILNLALKVASKILDVEINKNDTFIHLVKNVLKEVKGLPSVDIYAHIDDYAELLTHKEELLNIVNENAELSIYPVSDVARGSCIVESPFGKIDASIDSQLQELRNQLFNLTKEVNR